MTDFAKNAVLSADKPDQEALYAAYQPKVYRYLCGKLSSPADAEDLTSEVFCKVFAHLPEFCGEKSSVSTWIYTITRNTLYDFFRIRHPGQELDEALADDGDILEGVCSEETLEELADALEHLPFRQRQIVVLRYYKGLSLKDVAENLGISYSYTKLLHTDALKQLKKRIFL